MIAKGKNIFFCFLPFLGFTRSPTLNFTYFELTGLARHEILDRTKVAPRRKTLFPLILLFRCSAGGILKLFICFVFLNHLEGPRTTPREPFLNAPFTLAQTSFYVKLCLSHRFLPLLVARVDRGHVEEGRDSIELLAHLD